MNTPNTPDSQQPNSQTPNVGALEMEEIEPTEPWRPLVVPAIVVTIGLAIAWALFAHFGQAKPDASGAVLREVAYPVQVDAGNSQTGPGLPGLVPAQNETVLLVQARVTNISKDPLTIFDLISDVKMKGESSQSSAALPEDIDRFMQRFPELKQMSMQPLARHQVIAPGQSAEGLMVFAYPWTKEQWDQHKAAQLIVSFQHARTLVLPLQ